MGRTLFLVFVLSLEFLLFQFNQTMMFFAILLGPGFMIYTLAAFSKKTFLLIEKENGTPQDPQNKE